MTDPDPHASQPHQTGPRPDQQTQPNEAAGAEPRSFGGAAEGQETEPSYADPAAPDADEAQIAADDAGASAMAERAGRDIEQEGR